MVIHSKIFSSVLAILPKTYISHFLGFLADIKWPKIVLVPAIKLFALMYKIDLRESGKTLWDFNTFNDFFARKLKDGVRKIDFSQKVIVSPVDGFVLRFGKIRKGMLLQAKDTRYFLSDLLMDERLAFDFLGGTYVTFYLAPKNYHRIHSPYDLSIRKKIHVPGKLFPVNSLGMRNIKNLFPRNERVITMASNPKLGKVAIVQVGATVVGRIKTTNKKALKKGQELGVFELGSAVILIFEKGKVSLSKKLEMRKELKLGEKIATLTS